MAEYIERKALREAFENADADVAEEYEDGTCDWGFGHQNILEVINSVPAADVAQVRHGRWVSYLDGDSIMPDRYYRCSECCDRGWGRKWPYCPNCGAKMECVTDV